MDVRHVGGSVADVDELVRAAGRRDHDLTGPRLDRLAVDREVDPALVHDEGLLVRMAMQAWPAAGRRPCEEERDAGAVIGAFETPRQIVLLDLGRGRRSKQHLHSVDGIEEGGQRPDHERQLRDSTIALTGRQHKAVPGAAPDLGGERQQCLVGTLDQPGGLRRGQHLGDRCEHQADPIAAFVVGHRAVEDRVRGQLGDHRRRVAREERVRQAASC